jgi:SNF2 family DNA or RNA helicase
MNAVLLAAFADELAKIAEVTTTLLPHQQRVVSRLQREDQPGLVAIHGLGSGKTLTSIAAQDALRMPATVVVPAALRENYEKERAKHLTGESQPAELATLQMAARRGSLPANPMLIVDEAHRLRESGGKGAKAVADSDAQKRLLLTGSPFYNRPSDLSQLVNIAAGENVLPADERAFNSKYVTTQVQKPGFVDRVFRGVQPGERDVLNPRKARELREIYGKWTDFHPGSTENFPEVTRQDVHVPMTRKQVGIYDALAETAPRHIIEKVKQGLPPNKREVSELNAFLNAVRQTTNSTAPFQPEGGSAEEPKIDMAFQRLQKTLGDNPRAKAVVYSNYLQSGIAPYKRRLEAAKIPYGEFTGEMPDAARQQLVRDYNEGKLRALLLSSAGGEGLDLKGTRLMQLLEPHWNAEKLKQVEGRGARYMSHSGLPPEEQKVLIERYLAQRPKNFFQRHGIGSPGLSADEYLALRSKEKEDLIGQFRELLPQQRTA